jgi:hypothetical protein
MRDPLRPGLWLTLVGVLAISVADADGPIPPRFDTTQISAQQWSAYLAEVKALPDAQCREAPANQYICDSSAKRTIWVFTREGHAAHPAVSRGVMVIQQTAQGATVGIDRSSHYAGDRAAFDAWMKEFAPLDHKQVAQWQAMLQPK